jgi:THO complex subunit 2
MRFYNIGNFDLDPDRTLDIILDTFSDQLIQHHQFFLDFLSLSPWAPRKKAKSMEVDGDEEVNRKGKAKEIPIEIGLEGDGGSSLIGQILGFKFAYYQVSRGTWDGRRGRS